ncbi:unnamed protein product, partial [Amoebophrya sp. A25]|eukprot:GSA25T00017509001.1
MVEPASRWQPRTEDSDRRLAIELTSSRKNDLEKANRLVSQILEDANGESDIDSDRDVCDEATTILYSACTET